VTSQYSQSSHSKTRTQINYPRGSFKRTLSRNNLLKDQVIRLRALGEEAFGVTVPQVKIANNWCRCSSMGASWSHKP